MTIQPWQIFGFRHNWVSSVNTSYAFNTAIAASERYKEQRRPLRASPNISQSAELLVEQEVSARVFDYLRACRTSIMYVPLFCEPLEVSSSGTGLTTINVSATANHWYLNNMARYLVVIDKTGTQAPALLTLSSVGATSVTVAANSFVYAANTCIIFPAFEGIINSFRKTFETPSLSAYQVDFSSYTSGDDLPISAADAGEDFEVVPDWSTIPSLEIPLGREVVQFDAAVTRFRDLTDFLGWLVEFGFTNLGKDVECDLIDFFCTHHGRHQTFWLNVPNQYFTLGAPITNGDGSFTLSEDSFQYVRLGNERFFMKLKDGTEIDGKIVEDLGSKKYMVYPSFAQDIAIADVSVFGRRILCRFEQDELSVSSISPGVSTASLSMRELVYEYDDVDPDVWQETIATGQEFQETIATGTVYQETIT